MASIVDRPKKSSEGDLLEIEKYTNGLIKFIEHSATPITIGIQGEWGSGKTSLLNTIKQDLCDNSESKHYSIWLNTWEYSLLSSPDETLIKIISGLVSQIGELTTKQNSENAKKAAAALGSLMKNFGGVMGGFSGKAIEMAGDVIESSSKDTPTGNSIKLLRVALQNVINEAIETSDKKAFIFFIDDLDRLDPSVAVNILELIKNLFDLDKCIFVLAIDYGVVVKGLQSKFGKMTDENEWEFRAFFDKIIQLPFSMPTANYNIAKYLQSLLVNVNYFTKADLENDEILTNIADIVGLSVGTNPRALKRLANSVALIEIIRGDEEKITPQERVIEFALICIQIAYPLIYGLIQKESDFTNWSEQFVYSVLKNKKIDLSDLELLKETDEFDEVWEQNIWKICQVSTFLKQRTYQLSKLLNFIQDKTLQSNEDMSTTLDKLLSMSSVTSVSAESVIKKTSKTLEFQSLVKEFYNHELKPTYQDFMSAIHSEFKIKSNDNSGEIYFTYKVTDIEFILTFWRDIHSFAVSLHHLDGNKKQIKTFFQNNFHEEFPMLEYNGKRKWGFINLLHVKYSNEEMQESQEYRNEIYQKTILDSMQKIEQLQEYYQKTQPIIDKVHLFIDKIEHALLTVFTVESGWIIDIHDIKGLKAYQSLSIRNTQWGNGEYEIYLSSWDAYFNNPYIGVLLHSDFKNSNETRKELLYKKLEANFNDVSKTSASFFRSSIDMKKPIDGNMYDLSEFGNYAYTLEEENKVVESIVKSLEKLASYSNDFTDLASSNR